MTIIPSTDAQLNGIGRVLVLADPMRLSVSDLRALTSAKRVRLIRLRDDGTVAAFTRHLVLAALTLRGATVTLRYAC